MYSSILALLAFVAAVTFGILAIVHRKDGTWHRYVTLLFLALILGQLFALNGKAL